MVRYITDYHPREMGMYMAILSTLFDTQAEFNGVPTRVPLRFDTPLFPAHPKRPG